MKDKGIGIFDSGVGGLTVVKKIMKILPKEKIIYLGDTARTPYGNKDKETVIRFSIENVKFLLTQKVKFIVVACNTSSAIALDILRKKFRVDIIGVIECGAKKAVNVTQSKRVGIIGTKATISSGVYKREIHKINSKIKVFMKPTPLLVPLVEEGWLNRKETLLILKYYLGEFKKKKIDTLVLGCTHYPLLKRSIKNILPDVNIVDSAEEVAKEVKLLLQKKNLLSEKDNSKKSAFFVTDIPYTFNKVGKLFLGEKMVTAKKVILKQVKIKCTNF